MAEYILVRSTVRGHDNEVPQRIFSCEMYHVFSYIYSFLVI